MKTIGLITTAIALLVLLAATPVAAQQHAHDQHHPTTPKADVALPPAPNPTGETKSGTMPMDMCRQMMGVDMTGMPMMGGPAMDPKVTAEMLQMRAEMMKSMADIMMTHARRMQGMTK